MKLAIIETNGRQVKVEPNEEIILNLSSPEVGKELIFDKVLLNINDDKVEIGQPYLANYQVKATVVNQFKGKKIKVLRYKSKSRYRKHKGFRASLIKVKINQINEAKTTVTKHVKEDKKT